VFSDPINFIDPNGHFAWNVVNGAIGALFGGWNAANNTNATFGSILSGIAIGGVTGFIGLNPATMTLAKIVWVGVINYFGNISNQLIANVNNLDHSQALMASILGISGVTSRLHDHKTKSEILKYIKEFIGQYFNGELIEYERCQGK